jgi:hypothetical protein
MYISKEVKNHPSTYPSPTRYKPIHSARIQNPPKHGATYTSELIQKFDYKTFLQNELKALAIYTLIINTTTFTYS